MENSPDSPQLQRRQMFLLFYILPAVPHFGNQADIIPFFHQQAKQSLRSEKDIIGYENAYLHKGVL